MKHHPTRKVNVFCLPVLQFDLFTVKIQQNQEESLVDCHNISLPLVKRKQNKHFGSCSTLD